MIFYRFTNISQCSGFSFKVLLAKEVSNELECVITNLSQKIKRNVMINDFSEGGLKMIDIESFNKSLKSSWIKKYLDPENSSSWKFFLDLELQSHGGKTIFLGNLTREDACCFIEVSDPFIKEILETWCEASFTENLTSEAQSLFSPLSYNSQIKIGNRPVFFKDWSFKGVRVHISCAHMGPGAERPHVRIHDIVYGAFILF